MKPEPLHLPDLKPFPNSRLPVLLYRHALDVPARDPAGIAEALFASNGWRDTWRNGIFTYHHYHANVHEALACVRGSVDVMLGGPEGERISLHAGDVVLLPAGTSHCNVGHSPDYLIVGAYATHDQVDMKSGDEDDYRRAIAAIPLVAIPDQDPVSGEPIDVWHANAVKGEQA